MADIIITDREQKLHARISGLQDFMRYLKSQGIISHFLTKGSEIRVWVEDTKGQESDIILNITNQAIYVVSGPCRVFVGKGLWKLPKYGFQKPLPSVRPIMKALCDSLCEIA